MSSVSLVGKFGAMLSNPVLVHRKKANMILKESYVFAKQSRDCLYLRAKNTFRPLDDSNTIHECRADIL